MRFSRGQRPVAGSDVSGLPGRGFSTSNRARRGMDHARSYRWTLRVADFVHGAVDARSLVEEEMLALPWVKRLQGTYDENAHRVFAATLEALRPVVIAAGSVWRSLMEPDARITSRRHDRVTCQPDRTAPSPAEAHLGDRVDLRIQREFSAKKAAIRTEIETLSEERRQLLKRLGELVAVTREEFGVAVEITHRFHRFYARRLQTYSRRLSRRREDTTQLTGELAKPGWVDQPCPWIPEGLLRRLETTDEGSERVDATAA